LLSALASSVVNMCWPLNTYAGNLTQVLTESGSAGALTHADALGERMQLLLAVGKRALQEWKRQSKAAGAGER
jgi:hypothetical protein